MSLTIFQPCCKVKRNCTSLNFSWLVYVLQHCSGSAANGPNISWRGSQQEKVHPRSQQVEPLSSEGYQGVHGLEYEGAWLSAIPRSKVFLLQITGRKKSQTKTIHGKCKVSNVFLLANLIWSSFSSSRFRNALPIWWTLTNLSMTFLVFEAVCQNQSVLQKVWVKQVSPQLCKHPSESCSSPCQEEPSMVYQFLAFRCNSLTNLMRHLPLDWPSVRLRNRKFLCSICIEKANTEHKEPGPNAVQTVRITMIR